MFTIQILLLIFFCFAIFKVINRFQAGELKKVSLVSWICFWLIAGVVVVIPNSTAYVATLVGIGRGADLVVYAALAIIFFVIFKLTVRIEGLNRDITKLTRKISLDKEDKTSMK